MANRVGQQLGNYRLTRLLGSGGFAEVYLGEHIYLKSEAAIKVLFTRLTAHELENFLAEGRTLVRLVHPHIVRVLDFGVEGDTPFLVMDYAHNGSLKQRYPTGSILPLPIIVDYVKQVSDALQYAHNEKVIHRDVKPANMLIGRGQEILLSDFGTAIVAQSSRYQSTQDIVGTIAYMAPEQIQAYPRPASDQYSLGMVVYEWLSGGHPFQGSMTEVIAKQLTILPPPLKEKHPSIDPAVEQVVMTALQKDFSKRFASMREFALALEQASHLTQAYAPTLPVYPPEEAVPTFIKAPRQQLSSTDNKPTSSQPSNMNPSMILGEHHPQTSSPLLNTYVAAIAPPEDTNIPVQRQRDNQRRAKLPVIVWLLLLFVVSFLIAGLVFSSILPNVSGRASTVGNSSPASTVTQPPTPTQPPTAVPVTYPNIAGYYSGTVHNTLADLYSTMTLTFNQDQSTLSGEFTVAPPLSGSGPFTGSIEMSKNFQFTVHSQDATATAPIHFTGIMLPDGSLSGSYCSVNQYNECDTSSGGHGTWSTTRQ